MHFEAFFLNFVLKYLYHSLCLLSNISIYTNSWTVIVCSLLF